VKVNFTLNRPRNPRGGGKL